MVKILQKATWLSYVSQYQDKITTRVDHARFKNDLLTLVEDRATARGAAEARADIARSSTGGRGLFARW